jgi:hypothetical protein
VPNIQQMRDIIVHKSDLLIEDEMPSVLVQLCAHVSGYEITRARWARSELGEGKSIVDFPGSELQQYAAACFTRLEKEQLVLLGRRRRTRRR